MGLNNIAVQWPRMRQFYDPVDSTEFTDFAELAAQVPTEAALAIDMARMIASSSTIHVDEYTVLIDLLLGLTDVLYATESSEEGEDPVIDPDGCAWIAGGLEKFISGHRKYGHKVSFETISNVLREALRGSRLAEQQLAWLDTRLETLQDNEIQTRRWDFHLAEIGFLARFFRRCADRGFAVYAKF